MGKPLNSFTDWTGITNTKGEARAGAEARTIGEEQAAKEQLAVDYLSQQNELPSALKTGAMQQYGDLYGIGGGDQQQALSNLQNSPIYQAIMGGQQQGEEAILRTSNMTGGTRSGGAIGALGSNTQDLNTQALLSSMSGLQGLMQTPTYDRDIYAGMGGIAQTEAQAKLAEQAGILSGDNQFRNFAQNERQYGHEVGMSFLGGSGGGMMGG